jgi:hypothetical protein
MKKDLKKIVFLKKHQTNKDVESDIVKSILSLLENDSFNSTHTSKNQTFNRI